MDDYPDLREMNGHPLRVMRCKYNLTLQGLADAAKIGMSTVWRAENDYPISAESRRRICTYFNKTSEELGLHETGRREQKEHIHSIKPPVVPGNTSCSVSIQPVREVPIIHFKQGEMLDTLLDQDEQASPEQQLGAWLALEACNIGSLFDAGWTLEAILDSLHVALQSVQGMPHITRRKLLQLSGAAVVANISLPTNKQISEEERVQLTYSLGNSIAAGWRLLDTARNAQMVSVGQTLLYLVQQCHALLAPRDRNLFYATTYNLLGKAFHFKEMYEQAIENHTNAHIAAMGCGNTLEIARSLMCQAHSYQALENHTKAIELLEEAFLVLGHADYEQYFRTKAHILACWAESAIRLNDHATVQEKLDSSASLLDCIHPNKEFDRNSWLQLAGNYAFYCENYSKAIQYLEQALTTLPEEWVIRQMLVLLPMTAAYAWIGDKEKTITMAQKTASVIHSLPIASFYRPFLNSLRVVTTVFARNQSIHDLIGDIRHQLAGH